MTNRTQEDLDKLLRETIKEVADIGINHGQIQPVLELTNATRQFGKCTRLPNEFIISISKYIKNYPEKALKEIIGHEILHTVEGCFNHGEKWQQKAKIMNSSYGYNIQRLVSKSVANQMTEEHQVVTQRYSITCQDCGYTIHRQRKSKLVKNPEGYRCGKCKGKLKRTK